MGCCEGGKSQAACVVHNGANAGDWAAGPGSGCIMAADGTCGAAVHSRRGGYRSYGGHGARGGDGGGGDGGGGGGGDGGGGGCGGGGGGGGDGGGCAG